jgi:hypothetical protein
MKYLVETHASMERGNAIDAQGGPAPLFAHIAERFKPEAFYGNPTRRQVFLIVDLATEADIAEIMYIFEDILRRVLEFNGYRVKHVMNLTDVGHLVSDADTGEDKMEKGARRTGKSAWEIAEFYTQAFKDDLGHLNVLEPTIWCQATEYIPEQIETIRCIEAKGFTYRTSDGIYFDNVQVAHLWLPGPAGPQRVASGEARGYG